MQVWNFNSLWSTWAFKIIFIGLEFVFLSFCFLDFQISWAREGRQARRQEGKQKGMKREKEEAREGKRLEEEGRREEGKREGRKRNGKERKSVQSKKSPALNSSNYWLPGSTAFFSDLVLWHWTFKHLLLDGHLIRSRKWSFCYRAYTLILPQLWSCYWLDPSCSEQC